MESVELSEFVSDFEPAVGRVAETGERVRITDGGLIRRAEELTHWTDPVGLLFAGLERALGLALPRQDITTGHVLCARLATSAGDV
ncbi:hypothetical protein OG946_06720 [Streptomyces sp. NBC_01808]|uniref:hypothetical protein n=1 Tax=Streptomyces sp. NBC_01808 TaxID=2975947 RepID=UPI002DDBE1E8|nr:hypothetical protein [Streptomyces sp. NBC_01808]WSA37096.1 hypothetical protein OG946_06720 [Streptomyces sp. NBC_01808]